MADAIGLSAPVEYRLVGPDGGPINEPDMVLGSLTLSDAVRRAVMTDPGIQAAMARIRIAMADADQARLLPNPVLNVVLRWGPGSPQIEASLTQDFVQALQIPRRSSAADNRLRQVAAEAVTVALDVTSEVQERYSAAQASAALVPLLEERLGLLEKLAAAAKARLDAGEGTRGDVVTLDAQRVDLEVEIDRTRLAEREERLRLARLIGEPSSAATWSLDDWVAPEVGDLSETAWVDTALQKRPEIQAIAWRLKALGDDEALVRLLPWEGANVGVDVVSEGDTFVGPSVSTPIPIFDTGQARRARLTAEQIEARHDLTLAKRKIVEEVRIAFQTLVASKSNLARIQNQLIPLQQQRRQLAEDAYQAGQTDVTALFLAEQDLRVSQARSIEVERQAASALGRLQRAVGGPGVAASLARPPLPSSDADGLSQSDADAPLLTTVTVNRK
ncbi:MAG: TolC family protein [Phycisphaeraceae bacterium]|nr:TolC family protein [Phycisphaeraceae bacterium]